MSAPPTARSRSFVISDTDWTTYTRLLRAFAERPSVRLAYDRGNLEIMRPLFEHDRPAALLARFVIILTEELGLPLASGGSTTLRRRRKQRGLEPDKCFWIRNEPRVRANRRIDLRVDPPPDLAVEVDVTRSSLDRMGIYAALGVPEVWRLDAPTLTIQVLGADGRYAESPASLAFPSLTAADLLRFLALLGQIDENAICARFRAWVRQSQGGGVP